MEYIKMLHIFQGMLGHVYHVYKHPFFHYNRAHNASLRWCASVTARHARIRAVTSSLA